MTRVNDAYIACATGLTILGAMLVFLPWPPLQAAGWAMLLFAAILTATWAAAHFTIMRSDIMLRAAQLKAATSRNLNLQVWQGNQARRLSLPVEYDQLAHMAHLVSNNTPFSEREMIGPDKPFSGRPEFKAVRDALISSGIMRWRNERSEQQGVEPTDDGQLVLREYAQDYHPPTSLISPPLTAIPPAQHARTHAGRV